MRLDNSGECISDARTVGVVARPLGPVPSRLLRDLGRYESLNILAVTNIVLHVNSTTLRHPFPRGESVLFSRNLPYSSPRTGPFFGIIDVQGIKRQQADEVKTAGLFVRVTTASKRRKVFDGGGERTPMLTTSMRYTFTRGDCRLTQTR
jgi:hypothetical protein